MSKPRKPTRQDSIDSAASGSISGTGRRSNKATLAANVVTTSTADFLKTDDVLAAVLLADSFTVKFRPITFQQPKVLLPLLNTPMIDYAIEFLLSGGVQTIYIFTCAHADLIRQHVDTSFFTRRKSNPPYTIKVIINKECYSAGDALRHIDSLDLIKSDFVLLSGDCIANIKLSDIVKEHKQRVTQDKNTLMTLVLKHAAYEHRSRSLDDDTVIAVDPNTNQLLHYHNNFTHPTITLPTHSFSSHPSITFHTNLLDTHISICTPTVLLLLTDNFDYQSIRADFIPGILGQEDILGHTIYVHMTSDYAVRINDLHVYAAVSSDIIHRWSFPLVLDANVVDSHRVTSYTYTRKNKYREQNVLVARTARIGNNSVIGGESSIGSDSTISDSVIGNECKIGNNCVIKGSYIWKGVVIQDDVIIDSAILCDNVVVKKGARVEKGSIISYGVVIGTGFTVKPYSKLTLITNQHDDVFEDDEDEHNNNYINHKNKNNISKKIDWKENEVGIGGEGRVWHEENGEDEDEEESEMRKEEWNSIAPDYESLKNVKAKLKEVQKQEADKSDEEYEEEEEPIEDEIKTINNNNNNTTNNKSLPLPTPILTLSSPSSSELPRFYSEMLATLSRGVEENAEVDNIAIEMIGLKLSHDASMLEYAEAFFLALFNCIKVTEEEKKEEKTNTERKGELNYTPEELKKRIILRKPYFNQTPLNKQLLTQLQSLLLHWSPGVFEKMSRNVTVNVNEQVIVIEGLENACKRSLYGIEGVYGGIFDIVLRLLYLKCDLIQEDAVWEWERREKERNGEKSIFLSLTATFRAWLKETEEEDEEEEEEES